MYQFILLIHMFAAMLIVALVLVQQGRGASVGAAFGSGASQTVFGSKGSGSFLFRVTMSMIAIFFVTSIGLNYMVTRAQKQQQQPVVAPVVPATPVKQTDNNINNIPSSVPAQTTPIDLPVKPADIPTR